MTSIIKYGLLYKSPYGNPVDPEDSGSYDSQYNTYEAAAAARRDNYPGPPVKITIEQLEPQLPTTPGSVIRATADDEESVFVLTDDGDNAPWRGRMEWWGATHFTGITILFDAATTKED